MVDGIPYDGDIALLDPSMIASTTVLKSETAVALYGSRAANGVILISTKAGAAASEPQTFEALMEMGRGYGGMRRNFNDVAFWQPRLKKDKNGIAKVSVIYPDDITQWYVNVVGIGKNRYERAQNTFYVNSSLPLSVELSVPKFPFNSSISVLSPNQYFAAP